MVLGDRTLVSFQRRWIKMIFESGSVKTTVGVA